MLEWGKLVGFLADVFDCKVYGLLQKARCFGVGIEEWPVQWDPCTGGRQLLCCINLIRL